MKRNERITKIMTASPATVQVGQPVSVASEIMREGGFHHVPIVDGPRLVGMLSATDVLKVSYQFGADPREVDAVLDSTVALSDLMQADPVRVRESQTVRDAVDLLSTGEFHSLPVVDDEGRLSGIVTTTDVIRHLREMYG